MNDESEHQEWILCPKCGNKTRLKLRKDTVLTNFPLFCPKCKEETLTDAKKLLKQTGCDDAVYLLADGRYMDRINAVYIYDGKDTWTDESGTEWNKDVKQENAGEHRNDPTAELHRHARRVAAARGIDERTLREERDDVEHGDHADAGEDVGRVETLIFADAVHRQLWEKFQLHARSPPVVSMVSVSAIF